MIKTRLKKKRRLLKLERSEGTPETKEKEKEVLGETTVEETSMTEEITEIGLREIDTTGIEQETRTETGITKDIVGQEGVTVEVIAEIDTGRETTSIERRLISKEEETVQGVQEAPEVIAVAVLIPDEINSLIQVTYE